jgi:hypothetical protein
MSSEPMLGHSLPDLSSASNTSSRSEPTEKPGIERKQIGPWKILQKIAEGGMGAVYMAEQVRTHQTTCGAQGYQSQPRF